MHRDGQPGGELGQDCSPSDLTEGLLLLLSMRGWGMEAECVCGEFLWATADILLDDEIPRVSAFLLAKGTGDPALKAGKAATRSAPRLRAPVKRCTLFELGLERG